MGILKRRFRVLFECHCRLGQAEFRGEGTFALQASFSVTGGTSVTVGLDATRPGVGAYSFSNINLKAEQIRR